MRSLYTAIRPILKPRRILPLSLLVLSIPLTTRHFNTSFLQAIMGGSSSSSTNESYPLKKDDSEWRAVLSPEQVAASMVFCTDLVPYSTTKGD